MMFHKSRLPYTEKHNNNNPPQKKETERVNKQSKHKPTQKLYSYKKRSSYNHYKIFFPLPKKTYFFFRSRNDCVGGAMANVCNGLSKDSSLH